MYVIIKTGDGKRTLGNGQFFDGRLTDVQSHHGIPLDMNVILEDMGGGKVGEGSYNDLTSAVRYVLILMIEEGGKERKLGTGYLSEGHYLSGVESPDKIPPNQFVVLRINGQEITRNYYAHFFPGTRRFVRSWAGRA